MTKKFLKSLLRGVGLTVIFSCLEVVFAAPLAVIEAAEEQKIVINLASRSLALYKGQEKVGLYPVALGKISTPTPTGYYSITYKEVNPTWTDPETGRSIPSGEYCPLGYRWMGLFGNYGIHGTNRPDSIGHYVSNGCIRMFEKDVEALYDKVPLGTPVEITYNRIVVEKIPDGTVVYYIYPDGYKRQPLDVKMVKDWLLAYGVDDFESDAAIAEKINVSDGEPTYVGKPYNLTVNDQNLTAKGVKIDGMMFLPATEIAGALGVDLKWSESEGVVKSPFGHAVAIQKNDRLYVNADDLGSLFRIDGGVTGASQYTLSGVAAPPAKVPALPTRETQTAPKPKPEITFSTAESVATAPDKTSTIIAPRELPEAKPATERKTTKVTVTSGVEEKSAVESGKLKPAENKNTAAVSAPKSVETITASTTETKSKPTLNVKPQPIGENVAPPPASEAKAEPQPKQISEPVAQTKPEQVAEPSEPKTGTSTVKPKAEEQQAKPQSEPAVKKTPLVKSRRQNIATLPNNRRKAKSVAPKQTSPNAYRFKQSA